MTDSCVQVEQLHGVRDFQMAMKERLPGGSAPASMSPNLEWHPWLAGSPAPAETCIWATTAIDIQGMF